MDKKIEAVARALCTFDGKDPDESTRPAGGAPGFQRFAGAGGAGGPPLWTLYVTEAERFVVAAEALAPLLAPPPLRW